MDDNRILYADLLRIFAVFSVVLLHVSLIAIANEPDNYLHQILFNIFDIILRYCVPILIMISGMIFLNPEKDITIKKIFKKYVLKMIIVFIFWTFFYAFFRGENSGGSNLIIVDIKKERNFYNIFYQLTIGYSHLWFIYMISALYMITPFLRKIVVEKSLMHYFLLLSLIFTSILPFIELFIIEPNIIDTLYKKSNLHFILGYSLYFVGGYYISITEVKKNTRLVIYFFTFISLIIFILYPNYYIIKDKLSEFVYTQYFFPTTVLSSLSCFLFFKYMKLSFTDRIKKIVYNISNHTFGIYLIHFVILKLLWQISLFNNLSIALKIINITLFTFLISYILTFIIKKIPFVNNYIV